ncbi:kelch-like protein 10 [Nematolebias whitei]|uniref:kelch-like protein 10 n=1 Tax=Nematolebias whitei TaxID=451745 RepID=UPI001897B2FC|nr:kelch-like protein 10 [Nematolebias whitei]
MSAQYLKKVKQNTLIKNNAKCLSIISDALDKVTGFGGETNWSLVPKGPTSQPRLPPVVLLVTGGYCYGPDAAQIFELYDVRTDAWASLNSAVSVVNHGAVFLDRFVYLVGGYNQGDHLSTVQRFDFVTFTWENVASMNFPRCSVSVAVLDGCIYAMGGSHGYVHHRTAERYDPGTNRWTMIEPMHDRRSGAGAASLHGKVYICGGFNGVYALYAAEFYNPESHQWTRIAPMRCYRNCLGVAAYKGQIYAVGGCVNWISNLRSVEAYNPSTNRWQLMPSMRFHRRNFGLEVLEEQLFVVGGCNRYGFLSSVECYDQDAHMWCQVSHINRPRCSLSCCLLIGHYELVERLFPRGPHP